MAGLFQKVEPDEGLEPLHLDRGAQAGDPVAGQSRLAVDLVTADGQVVRASASEHPDLFWGVRGGGGNFGIVTAFQFQLHPVGPLLAGMRVITAGRGGTLRESLAMGQTYAQARRQHGESELLDELVKSPPSIDADGVKEAQGNIGAVASQRLREAIGILEAKKPLRLRQWQSLVCRKSGWR